MRLNKSDKKVKIIHILADGTQVDSIEGHSIPAGHPFYEVYANILLDIQQKKNDKSIDFSM